MMKRPSVELPQPVNTFNFFHLNLIIWVAALSLIPNYRRDVSPR